MSRKKRRGGRVTPKKTRPRHWEADGQRAPMVRPPRGAPTFGELLRGVSTILSADYLDEDTLHGFRDWRENVLAGFRSGDFADELGGLVAELFDDDEMRRGVVRRGFDDMAGILATATVTYVSELTDPAREQSLLACELELDNGESVSVVLFGEYFGGFLLRDLHLIPGLVGGSSPRPSVTASSSETTVRRWTSRRWRCGASSQLAARSRNR